MGEGEPKRYTNAEIKAMTAAEAAALPADVVKNLPPKQKGIIFNLINGGTSRDKQKAGGDRRLRKAADRKGLSTSLGSGSKNAAAQRRRG